MTLSGQLETELEAKVSASIFHDVLSCRPHHFSNMTPDHVHGVELHEGEWGKPGTVITWTYKHDGVTEIAKEIVEEIDDEKNLTTFKVIEGHLLDKYNSFYVTVQAIPKGEHSCLARWTIKYEKKSEDVPDPQGIVNLAIEMTKGIEAHHPPKQQQA